MTLTHPACPACGARVRAGSNQCDLCGTRLVVGDVPEESDPEVQNEGASPSESVNQVRYDRQDVDAPGELSEEAKSASENGLTCPACGWENPVEARYCAGCGSDLAPRPGVPAAAAPARPESMQSADEPSEPDSDSAGASVSPRRGALVVVASVILLVAALYVITEVSQDQTGGQSRAAADPALVPRTDPVPEEIAGDVDAIVAELPALSGPELQAKRRQLVDLYSKAGRLDLAGPVQEEIASDLDTEAEWIRAGNTYYDWMEMQTGTPRTYFARKAISAYQRALEINPGNHDVRTDMAIAYLYDPENTMQAILNTNMVLGEDSTHVQANFNRGIMLLQIGRFEQAKDQFRKVLELVGDPQSAVYQRAEAALRRLGEE